MWNRMNRYHGVRYGNSLEGVLPALNLSIWKSVMTCCSLIARTYSWTEGFGRCTRDLNPLWKPSTMFEVRENFGSRMILAKWFQNPKGYAGSIHVPARGKYYDSDSPICRTIVEDKGFISSGGGTSRRESEVLWGSSLLVLGRSWRYSSGTLDYSGQGHDVGENLVHCRRCLYQGFWNEVLRRRKRLICSFPFQGY